MEVLIYLFLIMFALGICGVISDFICKRAVYNKKPSKKVVVHVYAGEDRYISYHAKKCTVEKLKTAQPAVKRCA